MQYAKDFTDALQFMWGEGFLYQADMKKLMTCWTAQYIGKTRSRYWLWFGRRRCAPRKETRSG